MIFAKIKYAKNLLLLMIFLSVSAVLAAQEDTIPFHSSDMATYFSDEMKYQMSSLYKKVDFVSFYLDNYVNLMNFPTDDDILKQKGWLDTGGYNANIMVGVYSKIYAISILFNTVLVIDNSAAADTLEGGYFINGGVVWNSKFGHIGFFLGALMDFSDMGDSPFKWQFSFIPVINASEFPLLGIAVKKIEGALNMSGTKVQSVNSMISVLPIGPVTLGGFYRQEPLSFASTRMYGGFLEVTSLGLFLDLGWQTFYDIEMKMNFAEQTLYGKIEKKFEGEDLSGALSAVMSAQYFPIPKLGMSVTLQDDLLFFGDIYWGPFKDFGTKGFEFTLGSRIMFGI